MIEHLFRKEYRHPAEEGGGPLDFGAAPQAQPQERPEQFNPFEMGGEVPEAGGQQNLGVSGEMDYEAPSPGAADHEELAFQQALKLMDPFNQARAKRNRANILRKRKLEEMRKKRVGRPLNIGRR